jgi:hypothetical protein
LNLEIVRVFQVDRSFTRVNPDIGLIDYLVMDNIKGVDLEQTDWMKLKLKSHIIAALNEIHSIRRNLPGPVDGGHVHGWLWSGEGSGTTFRDVQQL